MVVDPRQSEARGLAQAMLGTNVELHDVKNGRNSRIFRTVSDRGTFALKLYPPPTTNSGDRLETEIRALRLMKDAGFADVPRVAAIDRRHGCVLLTWINGTPVENVCDEDIDQASRFLAAVHSLRQHPKGAALGLAREACLSGLEIVRQIDARLILLRTCRREPALHGFLDAVFAPARQRVCQKVASLVNAAQIDFATDLSPERRTLVPADFGFHNALRRPDGSLGFFDFEYFGWDDPAKLTADVLLHPGTDLTGHQRRFLLARLSRVYGTDTQYKERLMAYFSLFGLRWALIMLNEFVPERWHARVLAGMSASWEEVKEGQLRAAEEFLGALNGIEKDLANG